jgi:endopeptidase Clp ATP-binding regulatory subunit ClpX
MQIVEAAIGQVFAAIAAMESHVFCHDEEYFPETAIEIQDDKGDWYPVRGLITKAAALRTLQWSDGSVLTCAAEHWIRVQGDECRYAKDVAVGDEIERADGAYLICMANEALAGSATVYDLQIDTPRHLYQTADGIVHHNTLLCNTVARCLDVPLITYDMTSLTEAGFVGADVEDIIARLLQAANFDVKKCETGIVFLDEIDKKRTRESAGSNSRDVSGEGVQQALLKLLEGTEIMVPSGTRRGPNVDTVKINTKNILFILGGAFVGLDKIVERDLSDGVSVGFGAQVDKSDLPAADWLRRLEPQHLVTYGMIPEIVGRIPVVAVLDDLDEDQLVDILTEPKNALVKQYVKLFALDNITLRFDDDALREIAKRARKRKTNGRGLRGVLETLLAKTQYELPELHERGVEQVIFHSDCIVANKEPELIFTKMTMVS